MTPLNTLVVIEKWAVSKRLRQILVWCGECVLLKLTLSHGQASNSSLVEMPNRDWFHHYCHAAHHPELH